MTLFRDTFMTVYKGRLYPNYWDIVALLFVLAVLGLLAWDARQMSAPYQLGQVIPLSLDPHKLPGYALRTIMRMMIALVCSFLFTFTFATWAAKSKRAERIIIPVIDVLQSVPILGFLSITVVGFIRLFPGSLLGPECAAIFAIFTSQAWNMALGFYQTVRAVPGELKEAAAMFHLSAWQRFWKIDVPFSMPGLLWNTMMSMSAGWFFVVASEAISVSNQQILLPGIGSYIAVAIQQENLQMIGYAILTMFVVILLYDQIIFRPLVAWAEKFKSEQVATDKEASSWIISLFRRTRLLRRWGQKIAHVFEMVVNVRVFRSRPKRVIKPAQQHRYDNLIALAWNVVCLTVVIAALIFLSHFIFKNIPLSSVSHVFFLGCITALRVIILIILCSLFWVPVGVWIGLRPQAARIMQPIAQFFAAFPANLFYPLVVILIVRYHLNPNIWLTPLMILGAQWYIVFNVIAGASLLPKDLLQVVDNFGVRRWMRWRSLILPGIFPYYITGAITAAGGAWNASILAEVVQWGDEKLVATGLGSYISEYTAAGNFPYIALGIGVMCLFVLLFNRVIWRPLYVFAENRFRLE